jgi:glutathione synthase/RimK-type ligase-like ATP-grasp enzyme
LHRKKCLGRFGKLNFNKFIFLDTCKQLRISTPNTLITRKKSDLLVFAREQKNGVIVKSMAAIFLHCVSVSEEEEIWQKGMTIAVDEHKLSRIPEEFDLSLFQEKLDKKYELRVFYIDGLCFSQVIFSQKHAFSEVDYRQGLGGSEMRQCNFKLPAPVVTQIKALMGSLDLNIGCIDIVVTRQDDFVFLEVNPSGIFTDMMDNCNYDMHYEIAKYLAL